jgi:molybdate transport system regulatory protein
MKKAAARAPTPAPTQDLRITLKLDAAGIGGLGPGKVRLLELIEEHGSISAAGRSIGMSYRRAWQIVDSLNRMCAEPVVVGQTGGANGGGAQLAPGGRELIRCYRRMQKKAAAAVSAELRQFEGLLKDP